MNEIILSADQEQAKQLVLAWYEKAKEEKKNQIFRLFGYAGTGKTTTIRSIISELGNIQVAFGAYTGKAALVMKKQGLPAQTLHSMVYKLVPPNIVECERLYKLVKDGNVEHQKALEQASKVQFILNEESLLYDIDLLVLDECSMVNDEMLEDLLHFKVPILVLGDPGQLPPIEGTGALQRETPDIILSEIHRQSADSPIIGFATRARNNISLPLVKEGKAKHFPIANLTEKEMLSYFDGSWQVITGKNVTRRNMNSKMRAGRGIYPEVGERLICLRNNADLGLYNGLMVEVLEIGVLKDSSIELVIQSEIEDSEPFKISALRAYFEAYKNPDALKNIKWWTRINTQEFDFGYAITVHKAQGSQWGKVLFVDDNFLIWDKKMRARWLYTGITRAAEELTILKRAKKW